MKEFVNDVFKKSEEMVMLRQERKIVRKVKKMKLLLDMKMKLQNTLW